MPKAFAQCQASGPPGQACILLMSDDALAARANRILHDDALLSKCASCATDVPQVPDANGLIPYDHAKRKAPEITSRDELTYYCNTRFPKRGLVLSYGSSLSNIATFFMIDIDSKLLCRIIINDGTPESKNGQRPQTPVVWVDESTQLSPGELNPLIIRMNQIWRDGVSHKRELPPTYVTSALILLDTGIAFHDSSTRIHAPDAALTDDVANLVREHGLARGGGAPTSEPCDRDPNP